MSRNIINHHLEKKAIQDLNTLRQQSRKSHTVQLQGSEAIRLAMVSGYLRHTLDFGEDLYTEFIDIAAPDDATILVGTLNYTSFMAIYDLNFPSDPTEIIPMDVDNLGWGGVMYNTWLTASIPEDDPDYTTVSALDGLSNNTVPGHQIRVGSRVYLRQGLWTTSTVEVFTFYQVRMTIGWS